MTVHFESQLRALGIPCRVEAHDRMAVLVPDPGFTMNGDTRAQILRLSRSAGFSHVAMEIEPDRASVPGD